MKGSLNAYCRELWPVVRRPMGVAIALMVCVSLTEGAGLVLLIPTLRAAGVGEQGAHFPAFVAKLLVAAQARLTLPSLLCLYVAIVSARALLAQWQGVAMAAAVTRLTIHLRERLYAAAARADWLALCEGRSADFVHALTTGADTAGEALYNLMQVVAGAIMAALCAIIALVFSFRPALLVLVCGGAIMWALRGHTRAVAAGGADSVGAEAALYASVVSYVESIKQAKVYNAVERSRERFSATVEALAGLQLTVSRRHAASISWFEIATAVFLGPAIYLAVRTLALPAAVIVLLLAVFARLMPRLAALLRDWQLFVRTAPALAPVRALTRRYEAAAAPAGQAAGVIRLRRELDLQDVSFTYPTMASPAVSGVSLSAAAGQVIALVGASAAGKSTLADLITGLLTPAAGAIVVDGKTLGPGDFPRWRQSIGYVTQEGFLFNGTVRDNLLWAAPGAGDEQLRDALRRAAALDFTSALPGGIDSVIGERGMLVSHGERQRLALARALLREPSLLIIDEGTSSLDPDNEARVMAAIRALGVTVLLIAHRWSTIERADVVYMMEAGRIVEAGSCQSLLERAGRFALLYAGGAPAGAPDQTVPSGSRARSAG